MLIFNLSTIIMNDIYIISLMENATQQHLLNLRMISTIPKDGQLDTTGDRITIYNKTAFNWFMRVIKGDGRQKTVECLNSIYTNANKFAEELIKIIEPSDTNGMMRLLISFVEMLDKSLQGVRNLKIKYESDKTIFAQLEHIESDMVIPKIVRIVGQLPKSRHTDLLLPYCKDVEEKQDVPNIRKSGKLANSKNKNSSKTKKNGKNKHDALGAEFNQESDDPIELP
jgi:hypothetical protein